MNLFSEEDIQTSNQMKESSWTPSTDEDTIQMYKQVNRLVEDINPEEVSVQSIKDHDTWTLLEIDENPEREFTDKRLKASHPDFERPTILRIRESKDYDNFVE